MEKPAQFRVETNNGVLWSIICEIVYYALYPGLLWLSRRFGWVSLICISFALAMAFALMSLPTLTLYENGYAALGNWTWLIGLPVWISGCWLAENFFKFPLLGASSIWVARVLIYTASILLRFAKFHVQSPYASNIFTLTVFAFPLIIWLGFEMRRSMERPHAYGLDALGQWSYSLYLVHPVFVGLAALYSVDSVFVHTALILLSFATSYAFYLAVEKPSHTLARRVRTPLRLKA